MKNLFIVAVCGCAMVALADQYTIDWHKIAGGGGISATNQLSISGTIGQTDAGAPLAGTGYSLTGGFWSLFAIQNPATPRLQIKLSDPSTVMVSWPSPSTGFSLQFNTDMGSTNWTIPSQIVQDDGTNKFILVTPPTGRAYYRLAAQ